MALPWRRVARGDPPNIIIASRSGLTFNDFLWHLTPIVALLVGVFIAVCRVMFRSAFTFHPEQVEALMRLDEREAIRDCRSLSARASSWPRSWRVL